MLPFLLACATTSIPLKSLDDTGTPLGADTASLPEAELEAACPPFEVSPVALAWTSPAPLESVRLLGCVEELEVSCPDWIAVVAPDQVMGIGELELGPIPGRAGPLTGSCSIGGIVVDVQLD